MVLYAYNTENSKDLPYLLYKNVSYFYSVQSISVVISL